MPSSFDTFRERLERAFERRGARAAFVRDSGLPQSGIQRWLNGESEPTLSSLDRAAAALGVSPADLIRQEGTEDAHARALEQATAKLDEVRAALAPVPSPPQALPPAVAEIIPRLIRISSDRDKLKLVLATLDGIDPPSFVENAKERRR